MRVNFTFYVYLCILIIEFVILIYSKEAKTIERSVKFKIILQTVHVIMAVSGDIRLDDKISTKLTRPAHVITIPSISQLSSLDSNQIASRAELKLGNQFGQI